MCFSFEASIIAWFISLFGSMYMLSDNSYDKWIPLFILTFTQIQIMEGVIWSSINTNNTINTKATTIILFLLWLQPLFNSLIGYQQTNNNILFYLTLLYALIILVTYFTLGQDHFITTEGPNGHLVWNRYNDQGEKKSFLGPNFLEILYLIGLFLPFFFLSNSMGIITIIFGLVTFLITLTYYGEEFSSMWCYLSVALTIFALSFNKKKSISS